MAIEEMLTDLTRAINRLAGAVETANTGKPAPPEPEPQPEKPPARKPKAAKPEPEPEPAPEPPAEPEVEDAEVVADLPSREYVRSRLMELKKSSDATELVGSMGVTRLSQVPEERLAELLAQVEAKLEEQAGDSEGSQGVLD